MGRRRLNLSLKRDPAVTATRVAGESDKLVYVLVADKRLRYGSKRSRIAYIGTTKKGLKRITQSVAARSDAILKLRGVRTFSARIITCTPRRRVKTWRKLERALLIAFREEYGSQPKCNNHGSKMKELDEFVYFRRAAIRNIIDELR